MEATSAYDQSSRLIVKPSDEKPAESGYFAWLSKRQVSEKHGLMKTFTQNIPCTTNSRPITDMFCARRYIPNALNKPYSWSGIGETTRRWMPSSQKTVVMPEHLAEEIKQYQKEVQAEMTDDDEFVWIDEPPAGMNNSTESVFQSHDCRTLPSISATDNALLQSLGHDPAHCKSIMAPVTIDGISRFHIRQSKLRSNCYVLAPLASMLISPMAQSHIQSIISITTHTHLNDQNNNETYTTATVLLKDHETQETIPVTVTCDPLVSERGHNIYSNNHHDLWVTIIEKAIHAYIIAKCNQIETRPPNQGPNTREHDMPDDPECVFYSLQSLQEDALPDSDADDLKGDKKTIFDHGDANITYKILPYHSDTNNNQNLKPLKALNDDEIESLRLHINQRKPAVLATDFCYTGAAKMPLTGLKPGHIYAVLGEGYEVVNGNPGQEGVFIYDPYGEQQSEIRDLEIDDNHQVTADFSKGAILFEPYNTLAQRFYKATLY